MNTGNIYYLSSLLRAGFLLLVKIGFLEPCVDHRGLNQITIKNKPPLLHLLCFWTGSWSHHLIQARSTQRQSFSPHMPGSWVEDCLSDPTVWNAPVVFQNLINDVLCDFLYQEIPHETHPPHPLMPLGKKMIWKQKNVSSTNHLLSFWAKFLRANRYAQTKAFQGWLDWHISNNHEQLQCFLGFAKFYHRFIRNYSQTAAPLTSLTSTKITFIWTLDADKVFLEVKKRFSEAPVLVQLDPHL